MNVRDILKLLLILALITAAILMFNRVDSIENREEISIVRDAVRQAAITCYAVEGAYPDSVDYLRSNYQLAYDEDRFAVTLEAFASNVIPDIYVEDRYAAVNTSFYPADDPVEDDAAEEEEEGT